MGKRTYRATNINAVKLEPLLAKLSGRVVLGLDVAKRDQFVALMLEDRTCVDVIKWSHPAQTPSFMVLCEALRARGHGVEVAMEPSGTYGDVIRFTLLSAKFDVYRVSGKRVHDAAEVFDGVPSLHDAKAATLIARLHLDKASQRWPLPTETERDLDALHQALRMHRNREQVMLGMLEAQTARYWPALTEHLGLTSMTLLELLARYGGPSKVAADAEAARALMIQIGKSFLARTTVEAVIASARSTAGVPMRESEEALMRETAGEAVRAHKLASASEKRLIAATEKDIVPEMSALLGAVTAATVVACGVDPRKYTSAGALEKAFGLNLREYSSGTKKSGLHITKRGDSTVRRMLFMATLRLIQSDPIAAAWYRKKVARDGSDSQERRGVSKIKAVVALMRKLVKGLWHVGRGAPFDATKLFNVKRLGMLAPSPEPPDQMAQTGMSAASPAPVPQGEVRMS